MQLQDHISCRHFSVACGPPKALILSNINACTTDGPESRKTGHAALKQQLKLYSPQQQSLYTFIGLQYLWSAVRWRLLPTSAAAAAGRRVYSVLLHLPLFITGSEKGQPGIHMEDGPSQLTCTDICHYFYQKEGAIRNECPKDWIQTFCCWRRSEGTHQQWDENIFRLNCIFEHKEGCRSRRSCLMLPDHKLHKELVLSAVMPLSVTFFSRLT